MLRKINLNCDVHKKKTFIKNRDAFGPIEMEKSFYLWQATRTSLHSSVYHGSADRVKVQTLSLSGHSLSHVATMEHNNIDACIEEWETLSEEYKALEVRLFIIFI